MDNKVLDFLGDISYGIYMYHMIIIFGIILILKNSLAEMSNAGATILFYLIATTGVISVSFISKRLFENYFLKLKKEYRANKHASTDKHH